MKITRIEVFALRAPPPERPHWTSHFIVPTANEILVRLHTDEGIDGFGLATSYTPIDFAIKAWKGGLAEQIVGEDALAPERLYQKLFGLTTSRTANERGWSREALIRISAAVDIACWDIVGKAAGLPLYRLFGGFRDEVPAYVTCGYYREGKDNAELRDEMQMLVAQGHTGFKAKAGGLPLAQDIERMALMREVIGDRAQFMVDPNRAWDLATAIEAARLLEPLNPRWLEEPVRWEDDRRALKLLAQKTRIPLSGGESEMTSYGCRAMLEEQAIQILQFDCTMMGGFTEGRKLAALCELNHVQVAPHHDCFIHAHIVAASPAGCIVEAFTDPERDPLQAELYEDPPAIRHGIMKLKQQPGLGLTLSTAALEKYGQRIV
ncbi:mandelate racemase/muconate lactonizing enzyme family protein [Ramlibacter sp.]|uniref:mandelate racemase/muconate lactonizing enzyme family protein n=1 Tax=Ramlibacter sp. TaxID=1917967 RepID=UPI002CCC4899|nr:mandelate racemase/muconate lactonizing enzyme family protein [Ramlibacter sp.]HWI80745.1 mandelate racemase/muconate lactonizing enzyme family protein [Ramlibacter sp.]